MPTPPAPRDFCPDQMISHPLNWEGTNEPALKARDAVAYHLGEIARYAGGLILEAVARGIQVSCKPDGSSCTDADIIAEHYILDALKTHFPAIPIIAEEQMSAEADAGERGKPIPPDKTFFLVDPLDGTRNFSKGGKEYTVNIAVIAKGAPVAGAVYAPASQCLWIGGQNAYTAVINPYAAPLPLSDYRLIRTRHCPEEGLTALTSHRHGDGRVNTLLAQLPIAQRQPISSSIKFCIIAQGDADFYPRFGPTMEWDTAAGDAVLRAAGGTVVDGNGNPLIYGRKHGQYVNGPFFAWGNYAMSKEFC